VIEDAEELLHKKESENLYKKKNTITDCFVCAR
jgi:hypothetical protein